MPIMGMSGKAAFVDMDDSGGYDDSGYRLGLAKSLGAATFGISMIMLILQVVTLVRLKHGDLDIKYTSKLSFKTYTKTPINCQGVLLNYFVNGYKHLS